MKKFLLALTLVASSAFAENTSVVFPELYNTGFSAQLKIWNYTSRYITCSGPIFLQTITGQGESYYLFESIPPKITTFKTYYTRFSGDRILNVSHSIYCR